MTDVKKQTFLLTQTHDDQRISWLHTNKNSIEIVGQVVRPYKRQLKGKPPLKTNLEELVIYYREV